MNIKRGGSREPKKPPLDPPLLWYRLHSYCYIHKQYSTQLTSSVEYGGAGARGWSHLLVVVVSSR